MSGAIISGNPSPIPGPIEFTWRKGSGYEFVHSYTGEANGVRAMELALRANGAIEVSVQQQVGSAIATIHAHYSAPQTGEAEEIEETLEVSFSDETFPNNVNPAFIGVTDSRIKELDEAANDSTKVINTFTTNTTERYYMGLIRRGTTSYRAALPVITYTRNCPQGTAQRINFNNIGKIYTTSEVAGLIAAPVIFTIPAANVGAVAGSRDVIGYRFLGDVEESSSGRIRLIEHYVFGRYDSVLYGISTIV